MNKMNTISKLSLYLLLSLLIFAAWLLVPFGRLSRAEGEDQPDNPYMSDKISYQAEHIEYTRRISKVTGADALTNTTAWGVGGTDLGIPFKYKDGLYVIFGDTFEGKLPGTGLWRSNVLAKSTDWDFADGFTINDFAKKDARNVALEIMPGMHIDQKEMTAIPTGGIVIGDTIYTYYMSIRHWGEDGEWYVNFGGVYKSEDGGETFTQVPNIFHYSNVMRNFTQIYPLVVGDMVYLYGLPGGRSGSLRCARVQATDIENFDAYRYFDGYDKSGEPRWIAYEETYMQFWNDSEETEVVTAPCGEMSVSYNPYLKKYMATYQQHNALVMRLADNPWGPFSKAEVMVTSADFNSLYNAFTCESMMTEDGKVYFFMSQWPKEPGTGASLDYYVGLMEMQLKKAV